MRDETPQAEAKRIEAPSTVEGLREVIGRRALWGLLATTAAAFLLFPPRMALGYLAGGVISLLNFRDLKRSLERFMASLLAGEGQGGGILVARYYLKIGLLVIILAALIRSGYIDIIGLAAGLFLLPATLIYSLRGLYRGNFGGSD